MPELRNLYAKHFTSPKGPGDERPTASQIIRDYDLGGSLAGKVALVTGGLTGIGLESVRALHEAGADVYVAGLEPEKSRNVVVDMLESGNGAGEIELIELDLNSLESVKKAAQIFLKKSQSLHILINNAGVFTAPTGSKTVDGFEKRFGVNYVGHWALTVLLMPTLLRSSTQAFNSRVVAVASSSHRFSSIRWDDLNLDETDDLWTAYGHSKTGVIWMANYIDRTFGPRGVRASAVHPGMIWTGILSDMGPEMTHGMQSNEALMNIMQTPEQGAATTIWAAVSPEWEGKGGKYLYACSVGEQAKDATSILDPGYAPHAFDEEGEERLWKLTSQLTGISISEL